MNMNSVSEVYISYAWKDESEELTNAIEKACQESGISLVRDKNDLGYKGPIREFMQKIGQGQCVIVVISDKYLKSKNCMFELLEIQKHGDFYERIFPVVLEDAKIYKAGDRLDYIRYWEQEIKELEERIKQGGLTNLDSILRDLNLYNEIRGNIDKLTDTIQNMNTLTTQIHRENNFSDLLREVNARVNELPAKIRSNKSGIPDNISLTGGQRKQLREALQGAFRVADFRRLLKEDLNIDIVNIPKGESDADFFDNAIDYIEQEGKLNQLIEEAKKARPNNSKMINFYSSLLT